LSAGAFTTPSPALGRDSTVTEARGLMTRWFAAAGIDTPDLDARLLLAALLEIDGARLLTSPDRRLGERATTVNAAVSRRLAREPVSRILGTREFYGRAFKLSPATLDPRPDTETVIEQALAFAKLRPAGAPPLRILDLGTGTGCLLITLLAELADAVGTGTDISAEALETAAENARTNGVATQARWVLADALDRLDGPYDLLVTNPPYIPTAEIGTLAPEVRAFDPALALDGGPDGLHLYRRIVAHISRVIPIGCCIFEVGHDQAVAVGGMLTVEGRRHGWAPPAFARDLGGHARCVTQLTHI
jgi:release factor glutamine methyltransferase